LASLGAREFWGTMLPLMPRRTRLVRGRAFAHPIGAIYQVLVHRLRPGNSQRLLVRPWRPVAPDGVSTP